MHPLSGLDTCIDPTPGLCLFYSPYLRSRPPKLTPLGPYTDPTHVGRPILCNDLMSWFLDPSIDPVSLNECNETHLVGWLSGECSLGAHQSWPLWPVCPVARRSFNELVSLQFNNEIGFINRNGAVGYRPNGSAGSSGEFVARVLGRVRMFACSLWFGIRTFNVLHSVLNSGGTSECDQSKYFSRTDFSDMPIELSQTGISAIRSADPENSTVEPNMKWIGWPLAA